MSHPIDVGSVLGGRYKVTATVLTSHDQDLVLDGVDQVLNRDVSILVAGPENADQVAQSAREVATGERPGQMQILDLGVSDSTTYLITNHASAADLLDLVVSLQSTLRGAVFTDTWAVKSSGRPGRRSPRPTTASTTTKKSTPATSITDKTAAAGTAGGAGCRRFSLPRSSARLGPSIGARCGSLRSGNGSRRGGARCR